MSSSNSNRVTESWYTRLSAWNNRIYVRLLVWLAADIARLGMLWRGKNRERFAGTALFLHKLALYISQPETARLMADPQLLKQALKETGWLTILIDTAAVWTFMSIYGFVVIPVIPVFLLVLVLTFLFTHLLYLLALSGDLYPSIQDEGQRQFAYQASAMALRFVGFCLIVLSLCLAILPAWRTWVAIDLSALVLASRVVYLARLAQLRWAALAYLEDDESEALVEDK